MHPVSFNWYNISSKVGTVVFRNAWISVHFFESKRDRVALPGMACGWSLCYLIESLIFGVDGEQRDSRGENHIWNPDSRWSSAWFLLMKVFTVERLRRQYMKACACFYFLTWFSILCWIKSFSVYPYESSQFSAYWGPIEHFNIYFSGTAKGLKTSQVLNGISLLKNTGFILLMPTRYF